MSSPTSVTSTSKDLPAPDAAHVDYVSDQTTIRHTLLGMAGASLGGGIATLAVWLVLKQTNLPAFGGSSMLRALSTFGSVAIISVVTLLCYLWIRDEHRLPEGVDEGTASDNWRTRAKRPRWRTWLTVMVCYLAPAGLVTTILGIPLAATKLYLDGITVDQGFRTQFLTRLTDSWHLSDMNYLDMPSFYPGGWFWLGGRLANLLGLRGWEVFQPWSLVSMAAACCMLVPVWRRICGSLPVAAAIALVSTAVVLVVSAEEPYAAIVAVGVPAATIMIRRAVEGHKAALIGLIFYLGLSACMYTLYTAVMALSVMVVSVVFAVFVQKSVAPVLRMMVIGAGSMLLAGVVWAPYMIARYVAAEPSSGATANHYLPIAGAQIPLPMLSFSAIGVLTMLGLIYLVVRAVDPDVRAMGTALVVIYGWILASMVITLTGRTLLGFRMDVVVVMILATAGVLCLAELRLSGVSSLYPDRISARTGKTITQVMMVILAVFGIAYVQQIPARLAGPIDLAHTDTDGNGERADRFPADSGQYYGDINDKILSFGYVPDRTVVLSDELNFFSYYPYRGFQAMTSHYANPLGEFDRRNQRIEEWAKASWGALANPQRFREALEVAPWVPPQVFIFRGDAADPQAGWKFDLAEDIYPNDPNVLFRGVYFNPQVFLDAPDLWDVSQIGPFVVVVRHPDTLLN